MNEMMCAIINCLIPEWVMVLLGFMAVLSTAYLTRRLHKRGGLIMLFGAINYTILYTWIWIAQPTLIQRATFTRLATVYILGSMVYYTLREARVIADVKNHINKLVKGQRGGKLD